MITGTETSLLAGGRGGVLRNPAFPVVASDPSPASLLIVLHQVGKKELGQSSLTWSLQANVQRDVTNDVESRVPGKRSVFRRDAELWPHCVMLGVSGVQVPSGWIYILKALMGHSE